MKGCFVLFQDHPVVAFDNELDALREAVKTASSVVYVPFGMGFDKVRNGSEVFEPDPIDAGVPYVPNPPGIAPGMLSVVSDAVVPQAGHVKPNPQGTLEQQEAWLSHISISPEESNLPPA